jgi:hypothetical protein
VFGCDFRHLLIPLPPPLKKGVKPFKVPLRRAGLFHSIRREYLSISLAIIFEIGVMENIHFEPGNPKFS